MGYVSLRRFEGDYAQLADFFLRQWSAQQTLSELLLDRDRSTNQKKGEVDSLRNLIMFTAREIVACEQVIFDSSLFAYELLQVSKSDELWRIQLGYTLKMFGYSNNYELANKEIERLSKIPDRTRQEELVLLNIKLIKIMASDMMIRTMIAYWEILEELNALPPLESRTRAENWII